MQIRNFWVRVGLIGLFVSVLLLLVKYVIPAFNNQIDKNPLAGVSIITLFILEMPIAVIGRSLGLPIETGGAAFVSYSFNAFGYALTIILWAFIGAFFLWIIDKVKNRG